MSTHLHTLFQEHAVLNPDNVAVKSGSEKISYGELDARSNQLAHYLRKNGVQTGDKIKICIERSIEMLVGILGILKSGAAYVPINPGIPKGLLEFLSGDINGPLLITTKSHIDKIEYPDKSVYLDSDWPEISRNPSGSLDSNFSDSEIAVILYTSGSTGYPKGVLLSHRSLVNRLDWDQKYYRHTADDVVLQHAAYTFDFSILEIFMALASGGKLILARPEFHYESFYLIDLIQRERITKMGSVPSLLNSYIESPDFEKCTSLRQVFLGGETLTYDLQRTFFKKSSAELINIYGPTETSISVLNWTCKRDQKKRIIPIGYPVAGMRVYLLDENMVPVEDGQNGEIYIAGKGVADGYYNRQELTAERFLPDPFSSDSSDRIYKTGDLGKRLPKGEIQFLGRIDHQIKIRGLRVELEEIEYHLALQKSIGAYVVDAVTNKKGEIKLVAYIKPVDGREFDTDGIKKALLEHLPCYMVPSLYIPVKEFILSPNGKIDRKALPYPDDVRLLAQTSYLPPITPTQRDLVSIWERVLSLKTIGIADPFDRIGGDSLSATEIHLLMETELSCKLPLSSFANANTIREQAKIIESGNIPLPLDRVCYIHRSGANSPVVFILPVIGQAVIKATNLGRYLEPNHPFIVPFPFKSDSESIPESVEEVANYFVHLLECECPRDEYFIGGYSGGGLIAYEMASILRKNKVGVQSLFLVDTYHPMAIRKVLSYSNKAKRLRYYLKQVVAGKMNLSQDILHLHKENLKKSRRTNYKSALINFVFKEAIEFYEFLTKKSFGNKNYNRLLSSNYIPKPYHGSVVLISGEKESIINRFREPVREESVKHWREIVLGDLSVISVPTDHSSIMVHPDVSIVAKLINDHVLKLGD